jgi:Domain of unknown function (DUF397)
MRDTRWRKSSYSGGANSNCVEMRSLPDTVAVRDSKNPHGAVLTISSDAWVSFLARVQSAELG